MIKKVAQAMYIEAACEAAAKWPFNTPAKAAQNELKYVHAKHPSGMGGVTIAYRKTREFASSKMVEVAVAYCSKFDRFNKKIGVANATAKFNAGHTIQMPARRNKNDATIPMTLRNAFWDVLNYSYARDGF